MPQISTNRALILLTIFFVALKLSYFLLAIICSPIDSPYVNYHYGFDLESFCHLLMRKDSGWYQNIAENGYPIGELLSDGSRKIDFSMGQSAWAFFPGYPYFNRFISDLFSISLPSSAFLNSILFSFLGMYGFFIFCKNFWKDNSKAFYATLVLFLFPFHYFFSMFLTEAPFFAFLIWIFIALHHKKIFWASLLFISLVMIRPNGLFMMIPAFFYYLERKGISLWEAYKNKDAYLALLLGIPAFIVFMMYALYQHKMTGYYFAFSQAQQGWGKEFMFPLFALFKQGNLNYQVTSVYVVLVSIFIFVYRKRFSFSFMVMVLINILLPLSAGSTNSMIRYLSIVFPLFIVLSDVLYGVKYKKAMLTIILILHGLSFYIWLIDYPLGF